MPRSLMQPEFLVQRDKERCIECKTCVRQCGFGVHEYEEARGVLVSNDSECVSCRRCVVFCPTGALQIKKNEAYRENSYWTEDRLRDLRRQAEFGGTLLTGMGCDRTYPIYFDHILLNASQVTNPPIDPLREPIETRVYIGRRPEKPVPASASGCGIPLTGMPMQVSAEAPAAVSAEMPCEMPKGAATVELGEMAKGPTTVESGEMATEMPPAVKLEIPVIFSAMSFGSISKNAILSIARAAASLGTMFNTGEGGMHRDLEPYKDLMIVQVASGRFGVDPSYLNAGRIIEIKIGQGAKPGIGGHLPGEKVGEEIALTRGIPRGSDAISPAPHHDIYSIEDLRQLIYTAKEATEYRKPVSVKIAAVHNVAAIASGAARAGADIIAVDGLRGGTGAAPKMIRDNVGLPIELAISAVDRRLRREGLREKVFLIAGGGIRCSADLAKIICLGADAAYIGTAALLALGCHLCQKCYTGNCSWGIATQNPYLTRRINPELGSQRLINLLTAWSHELKEIMGAMGINAIESLRGNRLQLRGVGLPENELRELEIKQAGEAM